VKNVAGYDLTKFMVGQRGVFGKLLTLTTRTYKRPAGAILATLPPRPAMVQRLIPSPLRPQWTLLTRDALLCGYVGDERTLAYYSKSLPDLRPVSVQSRSLDDDIAHRAELWRGEFRASVPPARIDEFIAAANPATWIADAAFGIVRGTGDAAAIDRAAVALGGSTATSPMNNEQPELLMRLKRSFDPDNRLVPLPTNVS
jgi:FAD/FMN-containing dehydrogenase